MVKHIVMWRMAESEDKEQRAKDIKENLEALKGKIDVLVNIEVGLNFNDTDAASDVVLVSEFEITLNTKLSVQRMCVRM